MSASASNIDASATSHAPIVSLDFLVYKHQLAQGDVWREVAAQNASVNAGRGTSTYQATLNSDQVKTLMADYKKAILPSNWETDPAQLNNLAWRCFENVVALEEARGYAERAIEGAPDSRSKANAMDTLAEIVNALGDPSKAAEIIASAIELSDNEYFVKQLKRFRELADESVE